MQQNYKYFGIILSGIGILACLSGTGRFLLKDNPNLFARIPYDMPVELSISTPFVLPASIFTEAQTPVPYETLIPAGWEQFKTGHVEI